MSTIQDRLKNQPPFSEETEEKPQEGEERGEEGREERREGEEERKEEDKTKERTREQFEKLKESNKRLAEEVKKYQDVLSSLTPQMPPEGEQPNQFTPYFESIVTNHPPSQSQYPGLTQEQINETFQDLVDDQGYVNIDLLKEELLKRQEKEKLLASKIEELEQTVKSTKQTIDDYQRTEYMRKIHQKYPQIDPQSPQFDETMWEAVRNEIIGQWTTQGKEDVEAACEKWVNILYPTMRSKDKEANKKAQINAISSQPTSTVGDWEEHEVLVQATRKGKKGALAERLKRSGY